MGRHKKTPSLVDTQHRRAYEVLAEHAAKQCGLRPATAQAAAEDDKARDMRDYLWSELQRRIADTRTYSIDAIHTWMTQDLGVKIGRGSLQRLHERHIGAESAMKLRAERAQQVIDQIGLGGESQALQAGMGLAAQALFNALQGLDETALTNLTPAQIIKLMDTLTNMRRQDMETRYRERQLGELVKKFDREAQAKTKTGGGTLTKEDIADLRKKVFGEV